MEIEKPFLRSPGIIKEAKALLDYITLEKKRIETKNSAVLFFSVDDKENFKISWVTSKKSVPVHKDATRD